MNSKIFNHKLSWPIGKMCLCDQVDKRVDNSLEYSVKCVVEGVGMRVCKEGATWKVGR